MHKKFSIESRNYVGNRDAVSVIKLAFDCRSMLQSATYIAVVARGVKLCAQKSLHYWLRLNYEVTTFPGALQLDRSGRSLTMS